MGSLPEFDISAPNRITMLEQHQVAVGRKGIATVGSIIILHLLLTSLITILFLTRTRFAMLGETWSALSQLYNEDTHRVFEVSGASTYQEVKKWTKENGLGDTMVRLQGCSNVGQDGDARTARIARVDRQRT